MLWVSDGELPALRAPLSAGYGRRFRWKGPEFRQEDSYSPSLFRVRSGFAVRCQSGAFTLQSAMENQLPSVTDQMGIAGSNSIESPHDGLSEIPRLKAFGTQASNALTDPDAVRNPSDRMTILAS